MLVGQTTVSVAAIFLLQAVEEKHLVRTFVLGLHRTARLQFEQSLDMTGHGLRHVDPSCHAERFHEPCGIDRIAPYIERHSAIADNAGDDGPGMDADAQLKS